MKAIISQRGGGKTEKLISDHFVGSSDLLFVINQREKQRIVKRYLLSEKDEDRIFVFDLSNRDCIMGLKGNVLIDNVDIFLRSIFGREIAVVTFTGDQLD